MNRSAYVFEPAQDIERLNVLGTEIDLLQDQADGFAVSLQSGSEQIGPPPHSHDWDEAFYVLEGLVNFHAEGKDYLLGKGAYVHIPAGIVHAFAFGEGGAKMLEITGNRSHSKELFRQLDQECQELPPQMNQVLRIFGENRVALHI